MLIDKITFRQSVDHLIYLDKMKTQDELSSDGSLFVVAETLIDDVQQVLIFEGGGHSFFIVQLFVDLLLIHVSAFANPDVNFESGGKRSGQFGAEGQSDKRRHAAMGDRRREHDSDCRRVDTVIDDAEGIHINYIQLLKRQRMLWIVDIPNDVENLPCVYGIRFVFIQFTLS